jgi:hypothetical protein
MLENPISHSGGSRAFLIRPFRFTKPPSEADYVFFKRLLWLHAHQPGAQGWRRISTVIKVSSTSRRLVTLCSILPRRNRNDTSAQVPSQPRVNNSDTACCEIPTSQCGVREAAARLAFRVGTHLPCSPDQALGSR